MSRRFLLAVVCLSASAGVLFGLVVAGSLAPSQAVSAPEPTVAASRHVNAAAAAPAVTSFADIAERLNPTIVTIDAASRGNAPTRRNFTPRTPEGPELFERPQPEYDRDGLRRGAGTGFIIDAAGHILTNHHVVEPADRLTVRLPDGRNLRATLIGTDPDTDIALIKVDSPRPLPFAPLGDSDRLRVGEWVMAIGNPLAYEHTATVGIVSFIGRKLFNSSLDRYIQTDAAITFGNSGGPLIDSRGEVVGINAAVSARAANIGFAVPINQATAILPQLREHGRVSRGYMGVVPRDVDADLRRSLSLKNANGVLIQDVTAGSPGARAGLRTYDVIVAVDGKAITSNDQLIQLIASRTPGTLATLQVLRDNRPMSIAVKLAERPRQDPPVSATDSDQAKPSSGRGPALGLSVREVDDEFRARTRMPDTIEGILVSRVEPLSPAFDGKIERGFVILEVNRQQVRSVRDFQRSIENSQPGDVLAVYLYRPDIRQRALHTIRID
jgi:serine protease Do